MTTAQAVKGGPDIIHLERHVMHAARRVTAEEASRKVEPCSGSISSTH
jgi:hypothetical protein